MLLLGALPFLVTLYRPRALIYNPVIPTHPIDVASKLKIMNSHSMENATLCFPFYMVQVFPELRVVSLMVDREQAKGSQPQHTDDELENLDKLLCRMCVYEI